MLPSFKMKVLVTGGNGLIGRVIAKRIANDFDVYSISKHIPADTENSKISYLAVDLSKKDSIQIILKINPIIIIHCAAILPSISTNYEEEAYKINSEIDKNIFTVTQILNCLLIYCSSTIVYGFKNNAFNINEDHKTHCTSFYSKLKIESEISIQKEINKYIIFRINAPYGKDMINQTVLYTFTRLALQGKPLHYHGTGTRRQDFTNVDDIAQLVHNILTNNIITNGIFNISNGTSICMKNLAKLVVNLAVSNSIIEPSGQADIQEHYKASYSIKKAQDILHWDPKITLEIGIMELIIRLKENANSIHL